MQPGSRGTPLRFLTGPLATGPVRFALLLVAWLSVQIPGNPALAQEPVAPAAQDQSLQPPEDIAELVDLLENPDRREKFLAQLKALEEAHAQATPTDSLELSEALNIDQRVGSFLKDYLSLLSSSDIRASSVGKIAALCLFTVAAFALVLANNWLSRVLNRQLAGFRARLRLDAKRLSSLFTWQRVAGSLLITTAWLYALIVVVLDQGPGSTAYSGMLTLVQTTVAVLAVALLFLTIWEVINSVIEALAKRRTDLENRRAMTLLPVARNVLTFVLVLLSSLVILSELGIDVVPLLAGAGVVGIAIGFGAQTLVKDFLTGFTIIIEDLLQIDDVVTVAGRTGIVSHISMRKIELRSLEGTVHTVPFSAIDIVDNLTKDFSYYMLDIGVAYRENVDEVMDCLREIDEEMRGSDEFGQDILEPLEILGVDAFADSAVIIKARTKTRGRKKWRVGREFNRRIKTAFDKRNIEIPFPHQTIYFGVDKEGKAPPLPLDQNSRVAGAA